MSVRFFNKYLLSVLKRFALLLFGLSIALPIQAQIPAFPGAEGYGSYSKGGRGGELIIVSNLNDSGPGSLREAVNHEGPRTILFETAGIIDLDSTLVISNPYITIAGQSAPRPGITIRGEQIQIQTHNVIIRFLRFRPGDYNPRHPDGVDWNGMDAIDIGLDDSENVFNIILDHCSFSWATDENIGIWDASRNITIQNSIISEPLHHFPEHEQYPYPGQGLLIGSTATNISILKNVFVHNYERHPYMNANGHLDFRNNLIYNAGRTVGRFHNALGVTQTVNYVNNMIIPGPNSKYEHEIYIRLTSGPKFYNGKIYLDGNISQGQTARNLDNWRMVVDEETGEPFSREAQSESEFGDPNAVTLSAGDLPDILIPKAGAYLPLRDQVDSRLARDIQNGTGKLISQPIEVFGWPKYDPVYREFDPDNRWQNQYNIDLTNHTEANADYNGNGYTNIEEFLNGTDPLNDQSFLSIHETRPPETANVSAISTFSDNLSGQSGIHLYQNYPNPFNNQTKFHVVVENTDQYRFEIFNSIGQRVGLLVNSTLMPGSYELIWNPNNLPSGVYYARFSSTTGSETIGVVLLK